MKAIIIGAGRGARLMPSTADTPKCFSRVGDKRILDWTLAAFRANGIDDIVFIGGYQIDKVRDAYPDLRFCHNDNWPNNNILASLMVAQAEMNAEFICCYSDILFTPKVIADLLVSEGDVSLVCDTDWLARYATRTEHPSGDGETMTVANGRITRIHRDIADDQAHGEFIGVSRFTKTGAEQLIQAYEKAAARYRGKPFREAAVFEKAYLIHLYQEMIEDGIAMHHCDTAGDYIEIDTQQDFAYARKHWR
ncbi:MAG: phosphocholine cytidylyltransferase family protein [Verrucomicrobia bacterium]|nr:phosphocholine cytidylyltransferase family protein [Verrucomicrobiota bacterium]